MSDLVVYTIPECPFCTRVKEFLKKKRIKFKEVNVNQDLESWKKIYSKTKVDVVPILEKQSQILVAKPGIGIVEAELEKFLKLKK